MWWTALCHRGPHGAVVRSPAGGMEFEHAREQSGGSQVEVAGNAREGSFVGEDARCRRVVLIASIPSGRRGLRVPSPAVLIRFKREYSEFKEVHLRGHCVL